MQSDPSQHIYSLKENIPLMAETCWQLAAVTLWNEQEFSGKNRERCTATFHQELLQGYDPFKKYLQLIERIMLCRENKEYSEFEYNMPPAKWLISKAQGSFIWSNRILWHTNMLRRSVTLFQLERKALGEALFEMAETPTAANYQYWISWFRNKRAITELGLFVLITTHD